MKKKWMNRISFFLALVMVLTMLPVTALAEEEPAQVQEPQSCTVAVMAADDNIGRTGGGGVFSIGENATVIAYPQNGYRFVGWYVEEDTGFTACLSDKASYTFAVTGDLSLVAKYEANGGTSASLTVTAPAFTLNGVSQTNAAEAAFNIGEVIFLSFTDTDKQFLYWANGSNKPLSTKPDYQFVLSSDTDIHAVYVTADENVVRVVFRNSYAQIINDASYNKTGTNTYTIPANPIKMGTIFKGWYVADASGNPITDSPVTADDLSSLVTGSASRLVVIVPDFDVNGAYFDATVSFEDESGNTLKPTYSPAPARVGEKLSVTAPKTLENNTFLRWEIDGETVGYDTTYSLLRARSGSVALTAVYGADSGEAKAPIVNIIQTYASFSDGKYVISNTLQYYLPQGVADEIGFVYGTSFAKYGDENTVNTNLMIGSAANPSRHSAKVSAGDVAATRGLYTFNGRLSMPTTTLYIRAYVIYRDANGDLQTAYSAPVHKNYYDLSGAVSAKEEDGKQLTVSEAIVSQSQGSDTGVTATATIPQGVRLSEGASTLEVVVNQTENAAAAVESGAVAVAQAKEDLHDDNAETVYYDVSVSGVHENNNAAIVVCINGALVRGLNPENVKVYHNDTAMNAGNSSNLTAENTYYYDPVTGNIYLCISQFSMFTFAYVKETAEVTKAPEAISGLTYNGEAQALVTAGTAVGGTMQYKLGENGEYSPAIPAIPAATAAGTYTVYYKVVGDQSHNDSAEAHFDVTIAKAAAPAVTLPTPAAVTYDPATTLASVTLSGGWTWAAPATVPTVDNSGYSAVLTVDDANYNYVGVDGYNATAHTVTRTVPLTVTKADSTAASVAPNNRTYDGNEQDLVTVTGTATGGTMLYKLGDNGNYSEEIPAASAVGTYRVFYKVEGTDNYSGVNEAYVDVTIAKAPATFSHSANFANVGTYLYRVGNGNTVKLGSLFEVTNNGGADVVSADVTVTATPADNDIEVSGTYTPHASDWTQSTLQFTGEGPVRVTISEGSGTVYTLNLEVVEAINATNATSATGNNVVLLNDVTTSGTITVSSGKTLYGNGFKMTFTGTGSRPDNKTTDFTYGYVTLNSGALESVQIICPMFGHSYGLITANVGTQTGGQYPEMMSAVSASGDSIISNCYIKGARTNVFSISGNVKLENTVCECGATANIQLWGGSSDTLTLDGVTTIQYLHNGVYGAGILVGTNDSASNTKLVINDLTQYNWINSTTGITNSEYVSEAVNEALKQGNYLHNGYVNMGVIYLNTHTAQIVDNRNNASDYDQGDISITKLGATLSGQFYTVKSSANVSVETKDSAYAYQVNTNGLYRPVIVFDFTTDNENLSRDGGVVKVLLDDENPNMEVNFAAMFSAEKYTALQGTVTCVNAANVQQPVINGCLTFSVPGRYYVTYTVEDNAVYDKDGNKTQQSICYEKTIPVDVTMVNSSIQDAELEFNKATQKFYYYPEQEGLNTYYVQYIPLLNGLTIYDYDGENHKYLVFDGDSTESQASKIVRVDHENRTEGINKVSVTTFYFNNGGHLEMKYRSDANSGKGSSASTSIKKGTDNRLYAVEDANTGASDSAFYWPIFYYKYTGNSGKTITVNGNNSLTTSTEGLDLSKAVNNASGRTTEFSGRNEIMLFDEDQNPRNGIVFIGSGSLKLSKEKTSNDASGYYCYYYGYRAEQGTLGKGAFTDFSPDVHKITLNANAADANQTKDYILTTGAVNNATGTISRDGFTFGGWYTASVGGDKVGDQTLEGNQWTLSDYNVTADTTLHAHWLKDVTITFDTQGGGVIKNEETQSSRAITLPTPVKANANFKGWYDAAGNGDGTGAKLVAAGGDTYYVPENDITLYAHWEDLGVSYTVTYKYNDDRADTTDEYTGTAIELPTPIYQGDGGEKAREFAGWYSDQQFDDTSRATGSISPSSDITLYAKWDVKTYTITLSGGNGKISGTFTYKNLSGEEITIDWNNPSKGDKYEGIPYGTVSYTVTNVKRGSGDSSDYRLSSVKTTGLTKNVNWSNSDSSVQTCNGSFTIDGNVVFTADRASCFAAGTLITLADGTQKPVEELTINDRLLAWDFINGEYVESDVFSITNHGQSTYSVLMLGFDNGTHLEIIAEHGLFDANEKCFVNIDENNANSFIGHEFVVRNADGSNSRATLVSAVTEQRTTSAYSVITANNLDVIANGFLTADPSIYFLFPFAIDDSLTYNPERMRADVETYGLLTYEEFCEYAPHMTETQFYSGNGQYIKIALGKGIITMEEIIEYAQRLLVDQEYLID